MKYFDINARELQASIVPVVLCTVVTVEHKESKLLRHAQDALNNEYDYSFM